MVGPICKFFRKRYFLPGKSGDGLLGFDVQDANLRVGAVPVGRDRIEDQAEVGFGAGPERGGRDRFHINIGLAHTDQLERESLVLRHLVGEIAEERLHGNGGDGARAVVGDVAVEVGDLAPGQVVSPLSLSL